MSGIQVLDAGLMTTVQDAGRHGLQRAGIAPSGAVDGLSLAVANLLVGNDRGTAGLEMTAKGATLRFTGAGVIAITGGDFGAKLNGQPAKRYAAFAVEAGDVLAFGYAVTGCRAYLSVAGGLDIPIALGSRSTNVKCAIGGVEGRALVSGDEIPFAASGGALARMSLRKVPEPEFGWACTVIRAIPGPQDDCFTPRGLETFFSASYTITNRSDRMASVLEGPNVEAKGSTDIVSDGIPLGGIQIPADGKPIVMLADRQTTGGYAKIATVISADIPRFAQRRPGQRVMFSAVTSEAALQARRLMMSELDELERRMQSYGK